MKRILCAILLLFITANICFSQNVDKETFAYSVRGTDTLWLDKYVVPANLGPKPCIIFMFGGGFVNGTRDDGNNVAYLRKLAQNGYVAIGIDYRLGLKDIRQYDIRQPMDIVNILENTIDMAVEDLFDATSFVYENAEQWNINNSQIIANGSSAGAVAALQAEYAICTGNPLVRRLPEKFNYAGVIAFAGAIYSRNGDLKWIKHPAPIMMFHGDADSSVPYDRIEMYNMGLYGSRYIASQLRMLQSPYYFYNAINFTHEMAGRPMNENIEEIRSFIQKFVIDKKPQMIESDIYEIGRPLLNKNFEITDYLKANNYM